MVWIYVPEMLIMYGDCRLGASVKVQWIEIVTVVSKFHSNVYKMKTEDRAVLAKQEV